MPLVLTDEEVKLYREELLAGMEEDAAIIREADSYIPPRMRPDQLLAIVISRPHGEVVLASWDLGLF